VYLSKKKCATTIYGQMDTTTQYGQTH
jgi:hypothetical protein